ncbi:hypothetical protein LguiB_006942 [Lonicera macranthoides]
MAVLDILRAGTILLFELSNLSTPPQHSPSSSFLRLLVPFFLYFVGFNQKPKSAQGWKVENETSKMVQSRVFEGQLGH